jgi:Flp pilus assembly protein TadG
MTIRDNRGQALVITVVAMTVILGMAALALDVGSWYKQKRDLQATADAAALAGAQALPDSTSNARALAIQYAADNGYSLDDSGISFSSQTTSNDTISVSLSKQADGFFSKVFGIDSVNVGAHASARTDGVSAAMYVAPITVASTHPMLSCTPPPCTDTTSIPLNDLHSPGSGDAAGSFSLLDLIQGDGGNQGQSTVAGWMSGGFDQYMSLGTYYAEPSTFYNGSAFQSALQARTGDVVLFPVYQPPILSGGSGARFDIIGWVGFHIDAATTQGSGGSLVGHFTEFLAHGIQATSGSSNTFGVRAVQLVN